LGDVLERRGTFLFFIGRKSLIEEVAQGRRLGLDGGKNFLGAERIFK